LLDRGEAALSPPRVLFPSVVSALSELWIRSPSISNLLDSDLITAAVRLASVENKNCRGSSAGSSKLFVFLETLEELAGLKSTTSRNQRKLWYKLLWAARVSVLVGIDRELEFLF
jgi:hypothetical protein